MSAHPEVANFLAVVEATVGRGRRTERLLWELEDHLLEAIDRALSNGASRDEAVRNALRAIGSPEELAGAIAREQERATPRRPMWIAGAGVALLAALITNQLAAPNDGWAMARLGLAAITLAQTALALWGPAAQAYR